YKKMKRDAEKAGLVKKEEDVLTYILYPAIAPSFLRGERKPEAIPSVKEVESKQNVDLPSYMEVEVDGEIFSVRIVSVEGAEVASSPKPHEKIPHGEMEGGVKSNMQGMVLEVVARTGTLVKKGDVLIVLEAMKMENPIKSPKDGKVGEIFVNQGDVVQSGDVLLVIE
ncbi:MAG TPA: biotin/lipoyl-containing protein, partial [Methanomicrobiales archaeon]|nr:biotin/lipoyl-containing protein [Methanomicrobiales archaeon]